MVHAPHWPTPQPNFVPTKSRLSRSTQSMGVSGATSTVRDRPFTLRVYFMVLERTRFQIPSVNPGSEETGNERIARLLKLPARQSTRWVGPGEQPRASVAGEAQAGITCMAG